MIEGKQLESHLETSAILHMLKDEAFDYIKQNLETNSKLTEKDVQRFLMERISAEGLTTDGMQAIVAITKNAAEPHHEATNDEIKKGELVLIDIWARKNNLEEIYADITWMAYCGTTKELPEQYKEYFSLLVEARTQALQILEHEKVQAWEVDEACRNVLKKAGHGESFVHRTGHPIDTAVHGKGYSIDSIKKKEEHLFTKGDLFSIEPGIYYPGKIGLRTEIDVYISENNVFENKLSKNEFAEMRNESRVLVTGPTQEEIICLL